MDQTLTASALGAAAYGRVDFDVSLVALCADTGLTREELTRGLWMLQKEGLCQYSLGDSAVWLCVDDAAALSGGQWAGVSASVGASASASASASV